MTYAVLCEEDYKSTNDIQYFEVSLFNQIYCFQFNICEKPEINCENDKTYRFQSLYQYYKLKSIENVYMPKDFTENRQSNEMFMK